jgi:hypothetical protein
VEHSDPQIIDNFLTALASPGRLTPTNAKLVPSARSKTQRKRCTCGTCRQCLDNNRWELIFNAKFADPDYYKDRPVRHSSPLDSLG